MSYKHFKKEYQQVDLMYLKMVSQLKRIDELASTKMISPDELDMVKGWAEKVRDTWHNIGYFNYLMKRPNGKAQIDHYFKAQEEEYLEVKEEYDDLIKASVDENNALIKTNLEGMLKDLKANYDLSRYIKYIINKPNSKRGKRRYFKEHFWKQLDYARTLDGELLYMAKYIEKIQSFIKQLEEEEEK